MVSVKLWRTEKTPVQTTHTMFSTSLLLLLAAASYVHGEELTQPASMTVQPGQSLSIHCKVSYSVTSYRTDWIRQPAGKALEWIGEISSGGSTGNASCLPKAQTLTCQSKQLIRLQIYMKKY
ncbi:hypothetical protein QTP70_016303 [Hemibagrus guttatus]|uniref:Ig-like domain-containing protein n=1 Tax=Hemibagrus guttatus TaxID=175788 RepID=A0AAE0QHD5_9TELE|nr:hypothetical protein QTP70_016303 [Hemibagrus guttatus]